MAKRVLSLEAINSIFETLFSLNDNGDTLDLLNRLKGAITGRLLSEVAEEKVSTRRQFEAKSFTLDEAVEAFGLSYSYKIRNYDKHHWKIETMPNFELVQPSECFS